MMIFNKSTIFIVSAFLLYACSTASNKDTSVKIEELTRDQKGVVYIYWPGFNEPITFSISANGESVIDINGGRYFVLETLPGDLNLDSSANFLFGHVGMLDIVFSHQKLDLNIKPGGTYYVRCNMTGVDGSYKLPMEIVDEIVGLSEIKNNIHKIKWPLVQIYQDEHKGVYQDEDQ
jgi:hypothetical protein